MHEIKQKIKQFSKETGFDITGIAPPVPPPHIKEYKNWIDSGYHGSMDYLVRHLPQKANPSGLLDGLASVIVFGVHCRREYEKGDAASFFAKFAGYKDYHISISRKIQETADFIKGIYPPLCCRIFVDSGPVLERDYAYLAGLGWYGKNTNIISPDLGSFFLMGVLLTNLPLPPDSPLSGSCGDCRLCINACPSGALSETNPMMLDASKCLSYLTIEQKGDHMPSLSSAPKYIFGCDICQDVCPHNKGKQLNRGKILTPFKLDMKIEEFAGLTPARFNEIFKESPVMRTKLSGLLRNLNWFLKY